MHYYQNLFSMLFHIPNSLFSRAAVVLFIALFLSSCSVKYFYNNMDVFLVEYIDGLVSLDDDMETVIEDRASLFLAWHRKEQLPVYIDEMSQWQRDFGPEITAEQVRGHMDGVDGAWQDISVQLQDEMALLMPRLNTSQVDELMRSLADKNELFREDYVEMPEDERVVNYEEMLTDVYEDWLGDLSQDQLGLVREAAKGLRSSSRNRYEARVEWQREVRAVLDGGGSVEQRSAALSDYFDTFDFEARDGVAEIIENNRRVIVDLTVGIVRSASEEQREQFLEESGYFIRVFGELAED